MRQTSKRHLIKLGEAMRIQIPERLEVQRIYEILVERAKQLAELEQKEGKR